MTDKSEHAAQGRVASILQSPDGAIQEIVINIGQESGVKLKQKYLVFGIGPDVVDPVSRKSLGRLELLRGRGEVIHVQSKMATLRSIDRKPETQVRKKVIHPTPYIGIGWANPTTTEEIIVSQNEFDRVEVGDFVRLSDR